MQEDDPKVDKNQVEEISTDARYNYSKYKWEFLRRNQDFIQARARLIHDIGETSDIHKGFILVLRFVREWGVQPLYDPLLSYDDIIQGRRINTEGQGIRPAISYYQNEFHNHMFPSSEHRRPVVDFDLIRTLQRLKKSTKDANEILESLVKHMTGDGEIIFKVNITCPKARILESFERQLTSILETLKRWAQLKINDNSDSPVKKYKKYHFDNFDRYIKVWDLREKEGKSWGWIKNYLNLTSIEAARNSHKSAGKYIVDGIERYVKYGGKQI